MIKICLFAFIAVYGVAQGEIDTSPIGHVADLVHNIIKGGTDAAAEKTHMGVGIAKDAIDKLQHLADQGMDTGKKVTGSILDGLAHNIPSLGKITDGVKKVVDGSIDAGKEGVAIGAQIGKAGATMGDKITSAVTGAVSGVSKVVTDSVKTGANAVTGGAKITMARLSSFGDA